MTTQSPQLQLFETPVSTEDERRYVKAMAAFNGVHNGDLTQEIL